MWEIFCKHQSSHETLRKLKHFENVKLCRNNLDGNCLYSGNCWFIHEDSSMKENQYDNTTIQKLFDIVEKFTEKVRNVEEVVFKN